MTVYQTLRSFQSVIKQSTIAVVRVSSPRNAGITPFGRQEETPVIEAADENEGMKILFDWYRENGIQHIGYEDPAACYDHEMRYIGKGPVGCYELLCEIAQIARKLQVSGFIKAQFGRPITIIIHDLEYPWYCIEATARANPSGEADTFFAAMKKLGFIA